MFSSEEYYFIPKIIVLNEKERKKENKDNYHVFPYESYNP